MKMDTIRGLLTYVIVILVLAGGFYSLVLNEYTLDDLSKGALIGFMGMALNWAFGSEVAKATAAATTKALNTPVPSSANGTTTTTVTTDTGGTP